jgi:hypothetical protein
MARTATIAFKNEGDDIWLIGEPGRHLGPSRCGCARLRGGKKARRRCRSGGRAPATGECGAHLVERELVTAVHDMPTAAAGRAGRNGDGGRGSAPHSDPARWGEVDLTSLSSARTRRATSSRPQSRPGAAGAGSRRLSAHLPRLSRGQHLLPAQATPMLRWPICRRHMKGFFPRTDGSRTRARGRAVHAG